MQWRTLRGERIEDVLDFVRDNAGRIRSATDLSDGGLALAAVVRSTRRDVPESGGRGPLAAGDRGRILPACFEISV